MPYTPNLSQPCTFSIFSRYDLRPLKPFCLTSRPTLVPGVSTENTPLVPFFSLLQYISLMAYLWPKKLPMCTPKYECMDVEPPRKKLADKWMQQFFMLMQ